MNRISHVQRKHNLLETNFEDCSMLYDVEVGRYYVLNNVGSVIWGQINEKVGIDIEKIRPISLSVAKRFFSDEFCYP